MHGWAVGLTHLDICFSKLLLRGNRSDAPSTPLTLLGDLARVAGDDGEDRSCYAFWHAHNRLARTQRERERREPWLSAGLAIEVAAPTPSPACAMAVVVTHRRPHHIVVVEEVVASSHVLPRALTVSSSPQRTASARPSTGQWCDDGEATLHTTAFE